MKNNYLRNLGNIFIILSFIFSFVALPIENIKYAKSTVAMAMTIPNTGEIPHYFGPYPNWANSPMPVGEPTVVTITDSNTTSGATGAIATATITNGAVTAISIINGGTNYISPIVAITSLTGTGANATASTTAGVITEITITNGGSGYSTLTGGIKKFVDSLPGLGSTNANNLGQYIPVAHPDTITYPGADYYEIELREYTEKMHSDLPATKLRGYVQVNSGTDGNSQNTIAPDPIHYLGPLILSNRDRAVRIKFTNKLPTGAGGELFLPVDKSVMGAGMGPLDMPGMPGMKEEYKENRATLHLHGGFVPWISDGTPHQWTTPAGETTSYPKGVSVEYVPDMWFVNGSVVADTVGQITAPTPGATNNPGDGSLTFYYNNQQSARLMFYHDHSFGITRLNVYAGEAAGYLITDQVEQDLINGTNDSGVNPGLVKVLPDIGIPLIIQDRTFIDTSTLAMQDPTWDSAVPGVPQDGDLWYPHVYMPNQNPADPSGMNAFGRWHYGPWFWPPTTGVTQGPLPNPYYDPVGAPWEPAQMPGTPNESMAMEAFMDTPIVNGTVYPYMNVDPKAYRFRILNAADDRFLNLQFYVADPTIITPDGRTNTEVKMVPAVSTPGFPEDWPKDGREGGVPDPTTAGPTFIQIGTEGGFLPAPVVLPNQPVDWNMDPTNFDMGLVNKGTLILGTAERADVIVDFSQYAGKTIILYNDAPAAFPAADARYDYHTGDPDLTDIGGAPTTQAGYGPNIRTVMQIRVAPTTPATAYNLGALEAVFAKGPGTKRGVFEVSQDEVIIPQTAYNSAYNSNITTDNYASIHDASKTFNTLAGDNVTIPFQTKAIQDEQGEAFDSEYGRMSGFLGLELPASQVNRQLLILSGFASPPVEIVKGSVYGTPIGSLDDGTQIWKITHNGVDTHTIHTHLFNAQLINRVAWDGAIRPPDANELGWKETFRVNPLQDTIVAFRAFAPTQPFPVPNSVRLIDPTLPEGAPLMLPPGGLKDPNGNNVTVNNHYVNYGWEYVYHCHLLAHEEMDMMHAVLFATPPEAPSNLTANFASNAVQLNWNDNSLSETGFTIQKATNSGFTSGLITYTSPVNATAYLDNSIQPGQTYYYRVFANNVVGDTQIYADPSIGFPTATANSTYSNTANVTAGDLPPGSYMLSLNDGWNLVTLPATPLDAQGTPMTLTAENFGQTVGATVVVKWDSLTQKYSSHIVGFPLNNFNLTIGDGFFVNVPAASPFVFQGSPAQATYNPITGWNLLGWVSAISTTAETFGASLAGTDVVTKWDSAIQQYSSHIIGFPLNDFIINQGDGIFIHRP